MKVGDLVKYRPVKGWYMNTKIVGIIVQITKLSVFVQWPNQAGRTGYHKKEVNEVLERINAKEKNG
tara:strand:- start:129 stop:326 length:198 start_codon:yes stop_codon:yes gene_type:complete